VFWFNPSETFIDISSDPNQAKGHGKQTHWMAESGLIDVFLLPGTHLKQTIQQYMHLTGGQAMMPLFSLGYHQCRWNYRDEKDVFSVNAMFETLDYPYDVIWLDIEHTVGKRYFTWDKTVFPHPLQMQHNLTAVGRKLVNIVDPHLKRDDNYPVHKLATDKGYYIMDKSGSIYDGWCWPGSSSYLDFTSPVVRSFWASCFDLNTYPDTTLDVYIWNDMNEPSVFSGPEVSMPKDNLNLERIEHREWHNLYGIYMQMATADGLVQRSLNAFKQKDLVHSLSTYLVNTFSSAQQQQHQQQTAMKLRPFVLTRSFWAGSQRYGAMWTGDNTATWDHLRISLPMLMSINIAGLSFAGADVGGFFRDADAELFTRWYQAGAFTPFFRGHAHHDTKRRVRQQLASYEPACLIALLLFLTVLADRLATCAATGALGLWRAIHFDQPRHRHAPLLVAAISVFHDAASLRAWLACYASTLPGVPQPAFAAIS
jgi:alpha 1,3-glucosidase